MPPVGDVALALDQFFNRKNQPPKPITDTQAQLALQSLEYYTATLSELAEGDELATEPLGTPTFRAAAKRLLQVREVSEPHCELARLVYEQLIGFESTFAAGFQAYVKMLSLSGSAQQARELVMKCEQAVEVQAGHLAR